MQGERASAAGRAFQSHRAAMRLGNTAYQTQPQARPWYLRRNGGPAAAEWLEDLGLIGGVDAVSAIHNADLHLLRGMRNAHADPVPTLRIFQSIAQQIVEGGAQQIRVSSDRRQLRSHRDLKFESVAD